MLGRRMQSEGNDQQMMWKCVCKIGCVLALGAIINVAVAWGCAAHSTDYTQPPIGPFEYSDAEAGSNFIWIEYARITLSATGPNVSCNLLDVPIRIDKQTY